MTQRPAAAELIAAVRRWLADELAPKLESADAFKARVAANALAIAEREARLGPAHAAAERAALAAYLDEDAPAPELNRRLVERIRAGQARYDDAALLDALQSIALSKLAIDNPSYSTVRALKDKR